MTIGQPTTTDDTPLAIVTSLGAPHETNAPLGPRTWYTIGGRAAVLAHPQSIEQLGDLVARCRQHGVPMRVLGKGANLLVRDHASPARVNDSTGGGAGRGTGGGRGVSPVRISKDPAVPEPDVPGIVVALDDPFFQQIRYDGETVCARGGADLFKLVRDTARAGLSGLENIAGIPATVGGAIRMNAGGAFGEIGDCVQSATVMRDDGAVETLQRDAITFGYRHTDIAAPLIVDATFALTRVDPAETTRRMKEIFAYKKNSQPMGDKSAGCAFKNPKAQTDKGAGQLIDEAGLKGYTLGTAQVSSVHANFFTVDRENGRAEDVYHLIQHVEQAVQNYHGVALQREVVVWP